MEGKFHFPQNSLVIFTALKPYSLPETVMPESHNGDENCKTEQKATVPFDFESIQILPM